MNIQDVINSLFMRFNELKDVASGSFVYFLYSQVFHKKNIWKGLAAFLIGTICAMYMAPQIYIWFPNLNYNFVVFITGLLGMNITESLISINYRELLTKKINQIFDIDEKKD